MATSSFDKTFVVDSEDAFDEVMSAIDDAKTRPKINGEIYPDSERNRSVAVLKDCLSRNTRNK